jgi:hypothetical protein
MSRNLVAVVACMGLAGGCAAEQVDDPRDSPGAGDAPSTDGGGGGSGGTSTGGKPSSSGGKPSSGGTPSTGGKTGTAGATSQAGSGGSGTAGTAGTTGTAGTGGTPPKPANTNLPYTENFEDGEANGFLPWNEDKTQGTWAVVADGAGKVYQPSATVPELEFAIGGSSTWTDVALTVKVRLNDAESRAQIGIRFTAPKTYLFVEMAEGTFKLRGRADGSTADLVAPSPKPAIVAGTWYTVGITIKGTAANLTLDGMAIGTQAMANALIAKGGVALGVAEGSVSYDDVSVVAAP